MAGGINMVKIAVKTWGAPSQNSSFYVTVSCRKHEHQLSKFSIARTSPAGEDAAAASAFRFLRSSLDSLPSFLDFFSFGDLTGVPSATMVAVAILTTLAQKCQLRRQQQCQFLLQCRERTKDLPDVMSGSQPH